MKKIFRAGMTLCAGILASILNWGCGAWVDPYDFMSYNDAIKKINRPEEVVDYYNWHIFYVADCTYVGYKTSDHLPSFKRVHEKGLDDCDGYAIAAAALLHDNGKPPILMSIPINGGSHAIYVYEQEGGRIGVLDNIKKNQSYSCLEEMLACRADLGRKGSIQMANISYQRPDWIDTKDNMDAMWDADPVNMPKLEYTQSTKVPTIKELRSEIWPSNFKASGNTLAFAEKIIISEEPIQTKITVMDTLSKTVLRIFIIPHTIFEMGVSDDKVYYTSFETGSKLMREDGAEIFDAATINPEMPYIYLFDSNKENLLIGVYAGFYGSPRPTFAYSPATGSLTELSSHFGEILNYPKLTQDSNEIYVNAGDCKFINVAENQTKDRGLESHIFMNKGFDIFAGAEAMLVQSNDKNYIYSNKQWMILPEDLSIGKYSWPEPQIIGKKIAFKDLADNLKILDLAEKTVTHIDSGVTRFAFANEGKELFYTKAGTLCLAEGF